MAIKSYTVEQLKKMPDLTDYEYLAKMTDDDIDYSDCPDITELLKSGQARIVPSPFETARAKKPTSLRLDNEIVDAFKRTGPDWEERIRDTLREWLQWRNLL
jgi:uncharacterized protein (DUF4415 family)